MNGFFNIDKPFGISSAKAVWLIKKKFNLKDKIGHMGTLDPNATGVLVVGVGRANRLFNIMQNKTKTYVAEFSFGFETETLDMESEIITKKSDKIPTKDAIVQMTQQMLGKQQQVAPIFSAKNVNGNRSYELARQGKAVELKSHEVEIFKFELLHQKSENCFEFEIECGSGTYIRSLCRDLAYKLGSVATMTALRRTKCGPFEIEHSKTIENLVENDLISNDFTLKHLKTLELSSEEIRKIKNGIKIKTKYQDGLYRIYDEEILVGIAEIKSGVAKIPVWLV